MDKRRKSEPQDGRPCYLYRHWSDTGLLYIGISLSAVARLSQHRDKPWHSRITKVTVEEFPSRAEAEEAEARAICYEGPIHNIKGPREASQLGPYLAKMRAARRRAASRLDAKLENAENHVDVLFGCATVEEVRARILKKEANRW